MHQSINQIEYAACGNNPKQANEEGRHKKAYGNNELNSNPYKKENERLNNKRKKHLHAIRKLVIGASIELLIIIILIICIIL